MKQLVIGLLLVLCALSWAETGSSLSVSLTIGEVIGYLAGIICFFLGIMGFLVRRTIFQEIDQLKEGKQDNAMCELIEGVNDRNREEIKADLKDEKNEIKLLHQKIDRIMWALKLPPTKGKNEENML